MLRLWRAGTTVRGYLYQLYAVQSSGKRWPTGVMLMLVAYCLLSSFPADSGAITHLSENRAPTIRIHGGECPVL